MAKTVGRKTFVNAPLNFFQIIINNLEQVTSLSDPIILSSSGDFILLFTMVTKIGLRRNIHHTLFLKFSNYPHYLKLNVKVMHIKIKSCVVSREPSSKKSHCINWPA